MPTAPEGAIVKLSLDLDDRIAAGDIIETQTGRRYCVVAVREQQRGKHCGRQHVSCLVLGDGADAPGARVHQIRWYRR